MKSLTANKFRTITIAVAVAAVLLFLLSPLEVNAASTLKAPTFPKIARASSTSLKLTWHKVTDASGYEIFRYDKAKKKYMKVKTINSYKTVKWTNKKLKSDKKYIFKIRAYKKVGLIKQYSKFTYSISAIPYKKKSKIVNAGSNIKGNSTMEIGLKQVLKVNVTVVPAKYGTAKNKKVVDKKIRLLADPSSHVKLSGKDFIIGNKVGTVNIHALVHNGNVKKIKTSVVDYARPAQWINLSGIGNAGGIIADQSEDLISVFSYLAQCNEKRGKIYLDTSGTLINEGNIDLNGIEDTVARLLHDCPLQATLYASQAGVELELRGTDSIGPYLHIIVFDIQKDMTKEELDSMPVDRAVEIAKHWYVLSSFYGG